VSPIRGYVFDAYGTLFDVHSIGYRTLEGHSMVFAGRSLSNSPAPREDKAAWKIVGAHPGLDPSRSRKSASPP